MAQERTRSVWPRVQRTATQQELPKDWQPGDDGQASLDRLAYYRARLAGYEREAWRRLWVSLAAFTCGAIAIGLALGQSVVS